MAGDNILLPLQALNTQIMLNLSQIKGLSVHKQETGLLGPKEHQGTFYLVEIDVKIRFWI